MKPTGELPIAVRVVDKHQVVGEVRVTPEGNHFIEVTHVTRGYLEPRMDDAVMGKSRSGPWRVFLEDERGDTITTYCDDDHGHHPVKVPIGELRHAVENYNAKGGHSEGVDRVASERRATLMLTRLGDH